MQHVHDTRFLLCAAVVSVSLLLCLLNGERYAGRLEAEYPVARPAADLLRWSAKLSCLPEAHEYLKGGIGRVRDVAFGGRESGPEPVPAVSDSCGEAPAGVIEPCEKPKVVAKQPCRHTAEKKRVSPPTNESAIVFRGMHRSFLVEEETENSGIDSGPASPAFRFRGLHVSWAGKEKAEKLVDTCPVRCRVMMVGDSLMEDFGVHFYRRAKKRRGLQFILTAKFSTGLCRPDYFNWFECLPRTISEKKPDIVLYLMGANDGQPVWLGKGRVVQTANAQHWKKAYGARVSEMLAPAKAAGALPLWIGMPVMGGRYASLIGQTERATMEACAREKTPYVDNLSLMTDEHGRFQSFIKDASGRMVRIRRKDKQHMTPEGNRVLIEAAMPHFEKLLRQHRLNHPELCVYPDKSEQLSNPGLDITIKYVPRK